MKLCLHISSLSYPKLTTSVLEISAPTCTFGRAAGEVIVHDPLCSATHAMIYVQNNQLWLCDHLSTNGTYLNQTKITRALIKEGDTLRMGNTLIRLAKVDLSTTTEPALQAKFKTLPEPEEQTTQMIDLNRVPVSHGMNRSTQKLPMHPGPNLK